MAPRKKALIMKHISEPPKETTRRHAAAFLERQKDKAPTQASRRDLPRWITRQPPTACRPGSFRSANPPRRR